LIVLGMLALVGCGSSERSTTVAGTTFTSNDKDGTATISSAHGSISTVSGDAAAQSRMPDFAPRYPGSSIESAIDSQRDGRKSSMITLVTPDETKRVAEFYRTKFQGAGLEKKTDIVSDDGGMLAAEGGGKKASIAVSRENGKSIVIVSYTLS
jgi:hypothetical protein